MAVLVKPYVHPSMVAQTVQRKRELITQPWYDSQTIPAGAAWNTAITFFGNSNTPGQHAVLSNMLQVGLLPAPRAMKAKGFSAFTDPSITAADMKFLLRNAAVIFTIGDKEYWRGPIWMLPGGGGAHGTGTDMNTNGQQLSFNKFVFQEPIIIPSLMNFFVILQPPLATGALANATRLTLALWSTESRAVQ